MPFEECSSSEEQIYIHCWHSGSTAACVVAARAPSRTAGVAGRLRDWEVARVVGQTNQNWCLGRQISSPFLSSICKWRFPGDPQIIHFYGFCQYTPSIWGCLHLWNIPSDISHSCRGRHRFRLGPQKSGDWTCPVHCSRLAIGLPAGVCLRFAKIANLIICVEVAGSGWWTGKHGVMGRSFWCFSKPTISTQSGTYGRKIPVLSILPCHLCQQPDFDPDANTTLVLTRKVQTLIQTSLLQYASVDFLRI